MTKQKDPEVISSHKHTKITSTCRTTIREKDRNRLEKILYNKRHKEGTTTRQVGGGEL